LGFSWQTHRVADSVLWAATLVLYALVGLAVAALALDGAQQVTTGRPGFLPFERLLRKRVPATDADCVRRGVYELLQGLGVTFIAGPQVVLGLIVTGNLTGAVAPPASAYPRFVPDALFAGYVATLIVGLVLVIAAYNLSTKVRYVPSSTGARSAAS
jgi:hypothetical protein